MAIIVQKYGGSSVADPDKIRNVAQRAARRYDEGNRVVLVVSAMGDTTDDLIKATVKITNTGKAPAKSVLIDGTPPLGVEIAQGDLRQVYDSIAPAEAKEYRVTLKPKEAGNFSINLRTLYNDDTIGFSSASEQITVTQKERNYLYILVPIIIIIAGIVLFTIKRHKEYSY